MATYKAKFFTLHDDIRTFFAIYAANNLQDAKSQAHAWARMAADDEQDGEPIAVLEVRPATYDKETSRLIDWEK